MAISDHNPRVMASQGWKIFRKWKFKNDGHFGDDLECRSRSSERNEQGVTKLSAMNVTSNSVARGDHDLLLD